MERDTKTGMKPPSTEYAKAIQTSLAGHLYALLQPGEEHQSEDREVRIGDVGTMRPGVFERLFNAAGAVKWEPVPAGTKLLQYDLAEDIRVNKEYCKMGEGRVWHSPQLKCKRVAASGSLPGCIRYEIEKKDDKWAYALFCPREAVESTVKEDKLNEWKAYMKDNLDGWASAYNQEAANLVLVVGCVKTSQWARLILIARGVYTFEIDPESTGSAMLKLGDDIIMSPDDDSKAMVTMCADRPEAMFNEVQRAWREKGLTPRIQEYRRSYCLFLSYLKVEKDWRGHTEIHLATRDKKPRWLPGIA